MDLNDAVDELFGAGLDEFVAERKRLAKELRDGGRKDDAQQVAALQKPTLAAWVLNQLARRKRRDVDLLLDAGHRLREAQAGVLAGSGRSAFEQARKSETEALRRLGREAEKLLASERGGASATVLAQVTESLRAAAITESGRELLARGIFTRPIVSEGFDLVGSLAPAGPVKPRATKAKPKPAREAELKAARAALAAARAELREAGRTAAEAERAAERARTEAASAAEAAEAARAAADEAAGRVEEAQAEVDRLRPRKPG
jgi:hypothetical protein